MLKIPSIRLVRLLSLTTAAYGVVQVLRLATNVVLARLVSPELFGVMLIISTLRTGIDLLSDIGVSQNVVSNPHAEEREFYDTAWTLQLLRGIGLSLVCALIAYPVSRLYDAPILASAMPLAALYFAIHGSESISRYILQKRVALVTLSIYEIAIVVVSSLATIAFVLISPSVSALILAHLFSLVVSFGITHFVLIPTMRHRLFISKHYAREILGFGKWVFVSSVVYFLAMNFDRLYMGKIVSLAMLGVYGVARSFYDVIGTLVLRVGSLIVFPMVAESRGTRAQLRGRISGPRARSLIAAAIGTAAFAAGSGPLVHLLYDDRYQAAALMLPILSIGLWFSILNTFNEALLLGIGKPVYSAIGNTAKLTALVIGLPLGFSLYGMAGAMFAMTVVEVIRYVPLLVAQLREELAFPWQDLLITTLFLVMILVWNAVLMPFGLENHFISDVAKLAQL